MIDFDQKTEIIEISKTIQGEGIMAGMPGILIRTTRCNMNCQFSDGICDSSYTSWAPEAGKYTLNDLKQVIEDNPQITYAYVTGGNPSFHPELLSTIIGLLHEHNLFVSIEDNGTIYSDLENGPDLVILSPKLKNSVPVPGTRAYDPVTGLDRIVTEKDKQKHEAYRTNYASISKWIKKYPYQLKFVVTNEEQYDEIVELVEKVEASMKAVCFMPEGSSREQLAKRRAWLMEFCIEKGVRYTDRLHIVAFDTERNR